MNQIQEIGREELRTKLGHRGRLKLVLALAPMAHRSKRIPRSLIFATIEDALRALCRDDEIVVYCGSVYCAESIYAYRRLEREGYTRVRRYAGGIADWEAAGYPIEDDELGYEHRTPAFALAA